MESFRDKLRRLRREDGAGDGGSAAQSTPSKPEPSPRDPKRPKQGGMPIWLRHKLQARDGTAGQGHPDPSRLDPGKAAPPSKPDLPKSKGMPRDLDTFENAKGTYAARIIRRSATDLHGTWQLQWASAATGERIAPLVQDTDLAGFQGSDAVYLDIETTGLGGGVGTWPFMVALGHFDGEVFELWQGFLRTPGEEPALLHEVAERIAKSGALVSFFGKSFDRHRLEDKMRMHHIEPPFEGMPHLDLYHPLNRLYNRRALWDKLVPGGADSGRELRQQQPGDEPHRFGFENGKLSTMERELCGLQRTGDLSGAFAPEAWFDFLADREHLLEHVFRHNADDVWSLATLTAHLAQTTERIRPDSAPLEGPELTRLLGLASLAKTRCQRTEEASLLAAVQALLAPRQTGTSQAASAQEPTPSRAREAAATKDGPTATCLPRRLALWQADARRLAGEPTLYEYQALAAATQDHLTPRIEVEIAKLLEHGPKDYPAALAACERARKALITHAPSSRSSFRKDLDSRAQRLKRKVAPEHGQS